MLSSVDPGIGGESFAVSILASECTSETVSFHSCTFINMGVQESSLCKSTIQQVSIVIRLSGQAGKGRVPGILIFQPILHKWSVPTPLSPSIYFA